MHRPSGRKSSASAPVTCTDVIRSGSVPMLVTVSARRQFRLEPVTTAPQPRAFGSTSPCGPSAALGPELDGDSVPAVGVFLGFVVLVVLDAAFGRGKVECPWPTTAVPAAKSARSKPATVMARAAALRIATAAARTRLGSAPPWLANVAVTMGRTAAPARVPQGSLASAPVRTVPTTDPPTAMARPRPALRVGVRISVRSQPTRCGKRSVRHRGSGGRRRARPSGRSLGRR